VSRPHQIVRVLNFYMDDSGTRHPDKKPSRPEGYGDFFALGGVLIQEEDESLARDLHAHFCDRWAIDCPLHSSEIRHKSKNFTWLGELDSPGRRHFMDDLEALVLGVPVLGLACVVDRPGYNARYREKYGRQRWSLCRTAFCVSVERAAKYADSIGRRLRVLPEECNPKEDKKLAEYYRTLKSEGSPFDPDASAGYRPLHAGDYSRILYASGTARLKARFPALRLGAPRVTIPPSCE